MCLTHRARHSLVLYEAKEMKTRCTNAAVPTYCDNCIDLMKNESKVIGYPGGQSLAYVMQRSSSMARNQRPFGLSLFHAWVTR